MDSLSAPTCPIVPCPEIGTVDSTPSILNVDVSCFANYKSPDNPRTINLLQWLISAKYQNVVQSIRTTVDKKERDRIKATLPAITPSGVFTRREASALIAHSGFICLDIDYKGNEDIANYAALKEQLCRIPNVAYCGQSVSGTGYFVLIPITEPLQHGNQFRALRKIFQKRFGIRIDDTPDVSRLRGYSYDHEAYFNHQATSFSGIYIHQPIAPKLDRPVYNVRSDSFSDVALHRCIRLIEDAFDGQKHAQLNKAAFTAGGFIAGGILDEGMAVAALEEAIRRKPILDFRAAQRTIQAAIQQGKQQPIYEEPSAFADTTLTVSQTTYRPQWPTVTATSALPSRSIKHWSSTFTHPPRSWNAANISRFLNWALIPEGVDELSWQPTYKNQINP